MADADEFTVHLARVRDRFDSKLDGKIADSFADLDAMSTGSAGVSDIIVTAHRRLHEICGIAPTLGFEATGKAARAGETILRQPAKTKRALLPEELTALGGTLDALRQAAQRDRQSNTGRG